MTESEVPVVTEEDLPEEISSKDPCTIFFSHNSDGELCEVRMLKGTEDAIQVKSTRAELKMQYNTVGEAEGWACHIGQLFLDLTDTEKLEFEKSESIFTRSPEE